MVGRENRKNTNFVEVLEVEETNWGVDKIGNTTSAEFLPSWLA